MQVEDDALAMTKSRVRNGATQRWMRMRDRRDVEM